jgi:GGDEF domain-containing protein
VGTATILCDEVLQEPDADAVITALIGAADAAMYAAKRDGGNQIRHR